MGKDDGVRTLQGSSSSYQGDWNPNLTQGRGMSTGWLRRLQGCCGGPYLLFLPLRRQESHSPFPPPHPLSGETEQKQAQLISQAIKESRQR